MPSLIVMRGSHRMGPYRKADLTRPDRCGNPPSRGCLCSRRPAFPDPTGIVVDCLGRRRHEHERPCHLRASANTSTSRDKANGLARKQRNVAERPAARRAHAPGRRHRRVPRRAAAESISAPRGPALSEGAPPCLPMRRACC